MLTAGLQLLQMRCHTVYMIRHSYFILGGFVIVIMSIFVLGHLWPDRVARLQNVTRSDFTNEPEHTIVPPSARTTPAAPPTIDWDLGPTDPDRYSRSEPVYLLVNGSSYLIGSYNGSCNLS